MSIVSPEVQAKAHAATAHEVPVEVTGHDLDVALPKIAHIIKSDLGFAGSFTSDAEIISIARDLLVKAKPMGYVLAKVKA